MNNRYIQPHPFHKKISDIPYSKSYANRFLILATLTKREITIKKTSQSTDVQCLLSCLNKVGLDIVHKDHDIIIKNSFPECEKNIDEVMYLFTGDGGSTNRFLLPLLALGKKKYVVVPDQKMLIRPMEELIFQLQRLGVRVEKNHTSITLQGPIENFKDICVDCSQSTQFASALLLAFSTKNISITTKNLHFSKKYWELTQHIIDATDNQSVWTVPPDFSSMSYPLALAATDGEAIIDPYFGEDQYQGDAHLICVLKKMHALLIDESNSISVKKSQLKSIQLDCSHCLDIVPTLAYLCSYAEGKSTLTNIFNLQYKESDRKDAIGNLLNLFNVRHRFFHNSIEIIGPAKRIEREVSFVSPWDHRMLMTSYLFLRHNHGGFLEPCESVNKSFPNFFEIME